jgi:hypothetical protein
MQLVNGLADKKDGVLEARRFHLQQGSGMDNHDDGHRGGPYPRMERVIINILSENEDVRETKEEIRERVSVESRGELSSCKGGP